MSGPTKSASQRRQRVNPPMTRWLRMLVQESPTGQMIIALDGAIVMANPVLMRMSGYEPQRRKVKVWDCVVDAERTAVTENFRLAKAGETVRFETTIRRADGSTHPIGATFFPLHDGGEIVAVAVRAHDRAFLQEADKRRLENQQSVRLRELYLVAASAGRTPSQQIQAMLELGTRLLGCNRGFVTEIVGDDVAIRYVSGRATKFPPGHVRKLDQSFTQYAVAEPDVFAVDDVRVTPWKERIELLDFSWSGLIATQVERFGKLYGSLAFATDASGGRHFVETEKDLVRLMGALCGSALERLAHEERLGALAFYDALTSLPNRVLFDDRLEQTLVAARRHAQRFSIMYFDLDDFKEVNDDHGHAVGDEVLRVVGHRLLGVARESDTVARHGGDEFVLLQRFVRSQEDAMRMARRINEALRQPIIVGDTVLTASASIGVSIYPDHGRTARELLAHADAALYQAKAAGRDRAVLYKHLVPAN